MKKNNFKITMTGKFETVFCTVVYGTSGDETALVNLQFHPNTDPIEGIALKKGESIAIYFMVFSEVISGDIDATVSILKDGQLVSSSNIKEDNSSKVHKVVFKN